MAVHFEIIGFGICPAIDCKGQYERYLWRPSDMPTIALCGDCVTTRHHKVHVSPKKSRSYNRRKRVRVEVPVEANVLAGIPGGETD